MAKIFIILIIVALFVISGCAKSNDSELSDQISKYANKNSDFNIIRISLKDCLENIYDDTQKLTSTEIINRYFPKNIINILKNQKFPQSMNITSGTIIQGPTKNAFLLGMLCFGLTKQYVENSSQKVSWYSNPTGNTKYNNKELYLKYKQIQNYVGVFGDGGFVSIYKKPYYLFMQILPRPGENNPCIKYNATSAINGYVDENTNVFIIGVACIQLNSTSIKTIDGGIGYSWKDELFIGYNWKDELFLASNKY